MITPSEFRKDIYNLLDHIIKTGVPIEIKRKGKVLKVVCDEKPQKLNNLQKREIFKCDPDELIYNDWIKEWKE